MSDTGDTLSRYRLVNGEMVKMTDEEYAAEVAQRDKDAAETAAQQPPTEQTNAKR
jgi:thioesterase domain-containing protein